MNPFDFVVVKDGNKNGQQVLREFLPQDNGTVVEYSETILFDLVKGANRLTVSP
jgi:hypothetical protein